MRAANVLRQLGLLALILIASNSQAVLAQTPSPLQEWQYSGGIILARLFQPDLPEWRRVLGVASEVQPVYDGARAYRVSGGPVSHGGWLVENRRGDARWTPAGS